MFALADTPVLIWLYALRVDQLSDSARSFINSNQIVIPLGAYLELQYMHELGVVPASAQEIHCELSQTIGAQLGEINGINLITKSIECAWACDPFDRLIAAEALERKMRLITPDQTILENVKAYAFWEKYPE